MYDDLDGSGETQLMKQNMSFFRNVVVFTAQ